MPPSSFLGPRKHPEGSPLDEKLEFGIFEHENNSSIKILRAANSSTIYESKNNTGESSAKNQSSQYPMILTFQVLCRSTR
jgi:hypothetical protein